MSSGSMPVGHADPAPPVILHGRRLLLARVTLAVVAVLLVGLSIRAVPLLYMAVQVVCTGRQCQGQLTPAMVRQHQALGISVGGYATYVVALNAVFATVYGVVAALLVWRKAAERMALFSSLTLLTFGGATFPGTLDVLARDDLAWWPVVTTLGCLGSASFILLFYLFPDGRLVPRWALWLAIPWILVYAASTYVPDAAVSFRHWPLGFGLLFFLAGVGPAVGAQIYRYRRVSSPLQRQQTKVVVFGLTVAGGGALALDALVVVPVLRDSMRASMIIEAATYAVLLLIPASLAVAILRYRLWDVDLLINKALVYGALTATLGVLYLGSVVGLSALLPRVSGQHSTGAIAAATLVMAALVQPLRHRIQTAIDRRFYRRKYNAAQALAAFSARLRDEVDLTTVTADVLAVVEETVQPAHASVWLRAPEDSPRIEHSGQDTVPVRLRLASLWPIVTRSRHTDARATSPPALDHPLQPGSAFELDPDDPLVAYVRTISGVIEVGALALASPALQALTAAGVTMAAPLVSQGNLIGLLNLGPRRSQQDYSAEDRALLSALATQAAPALRVGQLVRQQQAEAQVRERMEQELRIARLIQQTLLPKALPVLPGWDMAAHYQPAREVGGDFYDVFTLPDGRLGIIVADVTDKGVPAALVMATTRSILRGATQQLASPGAVLERTNELLCPDIPPNMFVACFYAILDPASGYVQYANAGQDLPYVRHADGVSELRATGMPLGLMPAMRYEVKEMTLRPGECVLFYSDGLVEAHNRRRDMFGFPQLRTLVAEYPNPTGDGAMLIRFLLAELERFTGDGWAQEDDITLVTLRRCVAPAPSVSLSSGAPGDTLSDLMGAGDWRILDEWTVPSEPGHERPVMERVGKAVCALQVPPQRLERLKTAVSEATINAIEHGNQSRPELPVVITVLASEQVLMVRVTDQGGLRPSHDPETPNLEAKLESRQMPRGWGLFLIKNLVDDVRVSGDAAQRTVELLLYRTGEAHGSTTL